MFKKKNLANETKIGFLLLIFKNKSNSKFDSLLQQFPKLLLDNKKTVLDLQT